jgi:hypothetical protein
MVILSAWRNIPHCKNAEGPETNTGLLALQAILPNYGSPIQFENDFPALVSEVNLMETGKPAISSTVEEIRNLLKL